jgi:peptide/nickel transport system substrate-binding protein
MTIMRTIRLTAATALCALSLAYGASAEELTIGSSTEPSAIDPHFSRSGNNQQIAVQLFGRLINQDLNLQVHPGLAESWEVVDPTTWRITLREGVLFSDGTPLTPEDVVYSMERVRDIPNSPAPFTGMVGGIASMTIVDDRTIDFTTTTPLPNFMELAGMVYIVKKSAAEGAGVEDFNDGTATIGTGPYRFVEWVPGDHLTFEANEHYWGEAPDFSDVTYRFIANGAARVAALQSGAVDLIDAVPPNDVPSLQGMDGLKVFSVASSRLIYLGVDSSRETSPFVTDTAGAPLTPSPLLDPRVRNAMSMMIDRDLIIDRVLQGSAEPSGQQVPEGMGGHVPDLGPPAYDPEAARALLAEAGYPEGFGLTLHSSNDRVPGDGDVAQAIGQMFARGGITVNGVVTLPYNVYAPAATNLDYSVFLFSIGNSTSTSGPSLQNMLMTYDEAAGTGSFNRGRYSNPEFDELMRQALSEFDTARQQELLEEATRLAFGESAVIPLYWQSVHWAGKDTIEYATSRGEDTSAVNASIAE